MFSIVDVDDITLPSLEWEPLKVIRCINGTASVGNGTMFLNWVNPASKIFEPLCMGSSGEVGTLLLRRLYNKKPKARNATRSKPTTPPTTAPTIVLVDDDLLDLE